MRQHQHPYNIHLHPAGVEKAEAYLGELRRGIKIAGRYLQAQLSETPLAALNTEDFLAHLVRTKRPQIFAESAVAGDGSDWNQEELSILGDLGVSVPVMVYDNGRHHNPEIHHQPFQATLLYIPGALLQSGRGHPPADWGEVTRGGRIDPQAYYGLYARRLLPLLAYANAVSAEKPAVITIPGLGCGQFAGPFHGTLEILLQQVLHDLLARHSQALPNIRAVYYDPYKHGENQRFEIGQISYLVRPLLQGNEDKPQLCPPQAYAEEGDDFSGCQLFSFVAWDHVSWPGNDFYVGARNTDDGVKAAATSSMAALTGMEGSYNPKTYQYDPPEKYRTWEEVVRGSKIAFGTAAGWYLGFDTIKNIFQE